MTYTVPVIQGDGIGHEVISAALKVLEATGISFDWEYVLAGERAFKEYEDAVPDQTVESIKRNKVALKGPLTNFVAEGYPGPNRGLRRKLGLFAAAKCAKCFDGVPTFYPGVDLIVIREVREDTYAGAEQQVGPDAAVGIKFITRQNTHNVARFAMEFARKMSRKKITVAHKANALKLTDGLFLRSVQEVAKQYPDIECDHMMVDHLAYQLVKDPWSLDMILAPNVYGDIYADLIAGLAGSLGIGFGANFGHDVAMFEAVHGTAPKYAGKGVANPIGEILTGAMMLEYLGEADAARAIERAVADVLKKGEVRTRDLKGNATLEEMTTAIIRELR